MRGEVADIECTSRTRDVATRKHRYIHNMYIISGTLYQRVRFVSRAAKMGPRRIWRYDRQAYDGGLWPAATLGTAGCSCHLVFPCGRCRNKPSRAGTAPLGLRRTNWKKKVHNGKTAHGKRYITGKKGKKTRKNSTRKSVDLFTC